MSPPSGLSGDEKDAKSCGGCQPITPAPASHSLGGRDGSREKPENADLRPLHEVTFPSRKRTASDRQKSTLHPWFHHVCECLGRRWASRVGSWMQNLRCASVAWSCRPIWESARKSIKLLSSIPAPIKTKRNGTERNTRESPPSGGTLTPNGISLFFFSTSGASSHLCLLGGVVGVSKGSQSPSSNDQDTPAFQSEGFCWSSVECILFPARLFSDDKSVSGYIRVGRFPVLH